MDKNMIIEQLESGRKTRQELRENLHVSDREVRLVINELRKSAYPNICSSSQSCGYWLGTKKEVLKTWKEMMAKIKEMEKIADNMRDFATCHELDMWCDECKWRHICEDYKEEIQRIHAG